MKSNIDLHKGLAIGCTILSFVILIGGLSYSELFISNNQQTKHLLIAPGVLVMSLTIFSGWVVSCVAFLLSVSALFRCKKSRSIYVSLVASGLYAISVGIVYVIQEL